PSQRGRDLRRPRELRLGQAGEGADRPGQGDAGPDERLEGVGERESLDAHCADLADARRSGGEPGRLEVEDAEARVLEPRRARVALVARPEAVDDAAAVEVVRRELDPDAIAGIHADAETAHLAGGVAEGLVPVVETDPEHAVAKCLDDLAGHLDLLLFLRDGC